jgi:flagellar M-ring protein FliF
MEPLLRQLRELPARLKALAPARRRLAILAAVLLLGGVVVAVVLAGHGEDYQYAFTNLGPEDSGQAQAILKNAGIPFRLEADGSALAVPAARVYDARLLLAAEGLPRGGGVGFELFDRGDLGITEFTQKVNLRRAIEGELGRTIGKLAEVRSARVHVTLPEKGLYRDEDRPASAAVVVNLRPGRVLGERELAGVRHLVASAVPGLEARAVTVVDGSGTVLTTDDATGGEAVASFRRSLERDLEGRIVALLERAVGAGAVVARVTATVDATEVTRSAETYDPDSAVLRSERSLIQSQIQGQTETGAAAEGAANGTAGGVAGAAANQPLAPTAAPSAGARARASTEDRTRNYEVSKTVTRIVERSPRVERLSVAVIVDGVDGAPRPDAEVQSLGELAKRAVGFDPERGDAFEITSMVFPTAADEPAAAPAPRPAWYWAVLAGGALAVLALFALLLLRRRPTRLATTPLPAGARVADLEAALAGAPLPDRSFPAGETALRDRARELAASDPSRAAQLLKAWIAADPEPVPETAKVQHGR